MVSPLLLLLLLLLPASVVSQGCGMLNNCNGHGTCTVSTGKCSCYEGWGADTDKAYYKGKNLPLPYPFPLHLAAPPLTLTLPFHTPPTRRAAPDCSKRTCPSGRAWGDVPSSTSSAHALSECSNMGLCDRTSGACNCFEGFAGDACQRMKCPNDCSGHGQCLNVRRMASLPNALPMGNATTYAGFETSHTWDEDMVYGCVCDSSWTVGLGDGQTQEVS